MPEHSANPAKHTLCLSQSLKNMFNCGKVVECSTRKLNRLQLSLTIERERINNKQADTELLL